MTTAFCVLLNAVAGSLQFTLAQRRRRAGQPYGLNVLLSALAAVMILALLVSARWPR